MGVVSVVLSVVFGVLFVTLAANAVTTISTNIVTGGTLSVTGASTLTGLTSMVQASSTRFSVHDTAYFGGSATSTFSSAGVLTAVGNTSLVTASTTGAVSVGGNLWVGGNATTTASNGNVATQGSITSVSSSAGIGYATGAGCAVTQITNRSTGVTCAGVSGAITTDTTSLAAEAAASFTVTDTSVAIGDVVVVSQRSGSNGGNTNVYVSAVAAGSFDIKVANNNAAAGTAETGAIVINFAVIKAVSN